MQRVRPKVAINKLPASMAKRALPLPFWLSYAVYFGGTGVISLITFFFVWSILTEEGEVHDGSWFPAILVSTVIFAISTALHNVLLRRYKNSYLLKREKLVFPQNVRSVIDHTKFTLEKHASILNNLQNKSEAADAANNSSEAHLEAYRACGEYLDQVGAELPNVHTGSPRLAAFRNGQERVRILQKHHLLQWAGGESRELLHEAQVRVTINEKVETAQRALEVLDAALQLYPSENQLVESAAAIHEFIAASYVAYWVELAERAEFKENYELAIDHYRDALFYLSRESVNENLKQSTATQIESEIERLQELSGKVQTSDESISWTNLNGKNLETER